MVEAPSRNTTRSNRAAPAKAKRNPALDQTKFNNAAHARAASITNDPIMQSILADTAKTTLQEQANADRKSGGASMQETVAPGKNIEDIPIFAEGAQNWAALAFTDKKQP